ncbi:uncharacterized protein QC761_0029670 [Podospora bellae-mahoneyi]|uniref:cutinase n=1 Tax=Podospora bellae-mahoneyi TaxID=2093777 RepID=A0ABR0FVV5_9PEZI|nr:hypothetical protein QC761_0029670 [Podospora bellae-mahoneyi]
MRFLATVAALTGTSRRGLSRALSMRFAPGSLSSLTARPWRPLRLVAGSRVRVRLLTNCSMAARAPKVIFIYARGSTEGGNLGSLGSPTGVALDAAFGEANVCPGCWRCLLRQPPRQPPPEGTTTAAINEMKSLLIRANSLCPQAKIVAARVPPSPVPPSPQSSATIREQIKGVVLYGWTKNQQNNGKIPNYPAARLKVYCESGDLVCNGSLIVLPAHGTYADEAADEAPKFLISRIQCQLDQGWE